MAKDTRMYVGVFTTTVICPHCERRFTARGAHVRFCSTRCKKAARVARRAGKLNSSPR